MRLALMLAFILSSWGSPAMASPVVTASWDVCDAPPLFHRTVQEGGYYGIGFSVTGLDFPHDAYRVSLRFAASDGGAIPDAWRFDTDGCQPSGGYIVLYHGPRTPTVCPDVGRLLPVAGSSILEYDATNAVMRFSCEGLYPPGIADPAPEARFYMVRIAFDETYGAMDETPPPPECGGLGTPQCFAVTEAKFRNLGGAWVDCPITQTVLTSSSSASGFSCQVVSARATTWGTLKNLYR